MIKQFILFVSFLGSMVYAQNNYFRAAFCYSLPTSVERFDRNDKVALDSTGSQSKETLIVGTGGRGTQYNLVYGRKLTGHLAVELGVQYFRGGTTQADFYTKIPVVGNIYTTYARQGWQLRVMPSLVVSGSCDAKVSPYARMGLLVPVAGKTITNVTIKNPQPNNVYTVETRKLETEGAFSLGYAAAIGANFNVNPNLAVFGEFSLQSLSAKANKTTMVENILDGKDILTTQKVYQKETLYVDELNPTSNNQSVNPLGYNEEKPYEDLRKYSQYGNVGINIGLKYAF
ncbi:MAG: hypothetical protein ACKVTZ_14280 [Bacteroidia bacterium]